MTIKSKMAIFAKKNGLKAELINITHGFEAIQFDFDNRIEYDAILCKLTRLKNVYVDRWTCYDGGTFEGVLRVMLLSDFWEWKEINEATQKKLNEWWERYHEADEETKKLMACGKIA